MTLRSLLAQKLNCIRACNTVYDCLCLVAARRHDAILLTVDQELIDTAKKQSIKVADTLNVPTSRAAPQTASESAAD